MYEKSLCGTVNVTANDLNALVMLSYKALLSVNQSVNQNKENIIKSNQFDFPVYI